MARVRKKCAECGRAGGYAEVYLAWMGPAGAVWRQTWMCREDFLAFVAATEHWGGKHVAGIEQLPLPLYQAMVSAPQVPT